MLSKNIATEFRDKKKEINLLPLSFKEIFDYKNNEDINKLFNEYLSFGGMPLSFLSNDYDEKRKYLTSLFKLTYYKDIVDHNKKSMKCY